MPSAVAISTVAKSLAFQAPSAWDVLKGRGFDVTFAASKDEYVDRLRRWGEFEELRFDRERPATALGSLKAVRKILQGDYQFVQLQTPVAAATARLVGMSDTPSLYIAHGLHVTPDIGRLKSWAFGAVETALAGRTSAIGLVAQEDFELARNLGWGKRALIWRLPGAGIDLDPFISAASTVDRTTSPSTALICGELNANKDTLFALAVADRLYHQGIIERLTIVGDGPLRQAVEHFASQRTWTEHLLFSADMPAILAGSHLMLHTSHREGVPRVIIEAMASGLPVLARENRGSRELVTSAVGSVLSKRASLDDWTARAGVLLYGEWDPSTSRRAAEHYSSERFSHSYSMLLDDVMAGRDRGYVDSF